MSTWTRSPMQWSGSFHCVCVCVGYHPTKHATACRRLLWTLLFVLMLKCLLKCIYRKELACCCRYIWYFARICLVYRRREKKILIGQWIYNVYNIERGMQIMCDAGHIAPLRKNSQYMAQIVLYTDSSRAQFR